MRIITQDKRAQYHSTINQLHFVMRMLMLIFVALSVVIIVRKFMILSIDTGPLESNILINRLIYSPDCLADRDSLLRLRPGIIDLERFTEGTLNKCLFYGDQNDFAAGNLTLLFLETDQRHELLYNRQGYLLLKPRAGAEGPGGARSFSDWKYVLANDKGTLRKAILFIEVILPNN